MIWYGEEVEVLKNLSDETPIGESEELTWKDIKAECIEGNY